MFSRNPLPSAFRWRAPGQGQPQHNGGLKRRSEMLRGDLLKADLLSEIVLLGSGVAIIISLLLIVATVLNHA
jgi:hypothetical protein